MYYKFEGLESLISIEVDDYIALQSEVAQKFFRGLAPVIFRGASHPRPP